MLPFLLSGPGAGVIGIGLYARSLDSGGVLAIALLVAAAAFVVGGLLGFLFGIPRSLAGDTPNASPSGEGGTEDHAAQRSRYQSNTNLEQISDWLTKILVGVGLVELGRLIGTIRDLSAALKPALGGHPSSGAFALCVVFLYASSGFLILYLATRLYLPLLFTQADIFDLKRYTERIETLTKQTDNNARALALAFEFLDPESEGQRDEAKLVEAIKAASPPTRAQIFSVGREQRTRGNDQERPDLVSATIPVFRALTQADKNEIYHRNHAQLAYALRRAIEPDPEAAIEHLTKAIEIRDRLGSKSFRTYEYRRALARTEADPTRDAAGPSDPEVREAVIADLRAAARSTTAKQLIAKNKSLQGWLGRNGVAEDEFT